MAVSLDVLVKKQLEKLPAAKVYLPCYYISAWLNSTTKFGSEDHVPGCWKLLLKLLAEDPVTSARQPKFLTYQGKMLQMTKADRYKY